MGKIKDLTGQRFGKLLVDKKLDMRDKYRHIYWLCKCDCGGETAVSGSNLLNGSVKSCGCLRKETTQALAKTHGKSKTRIYRIWEDMKKRCYNPNPKNRKVYYDRNIKLCEEWKSDFIPFYRWAIENGYSDELTIDRIDNEDGYSPSNCRWVTQTEQQRNRRNNHIISYKGEEHCLSEWCEILHLKYSTLETRINKLHWDIERAFTTT